MDGILIIDKPAGLTSHDVVARCRRILRTKRVGHTGTLDPFATGVMVVLVGRATRLAQFLDQDAKGYEATVRFGFETDTGDRTGAPREKTATDEAPQITDEALESALAEFRGPQMQTPPMYSAKKIAGKKLYEFARQGIEIERKAVPVTIHELELLDEATSSAETGNRKPETGNRKPDVRTLRVLCSAGTYIRVLAEDIGRRVGAAAHLAELRRTRAGRFGIERAVTLEELENSVAEERLAGVLVPMNEAVAHLAEIRLSEDDARKIKNGMKLRRELPGATAGDFVRLSENAGLLAIGVYDAAEKIVQPRLVLV